MLLILFGQEEEGIDKGHALLLRKKQDPIHIDCPGLPLMADQMTRLTNTLSGRGNMRLGGYRDASNFEQAALDKAPALTPAEQPVFWSSQADELNKSLWAPLGEALNGIDDLIVVTTGPLHNISLEPGKPDAVNLTRLPSLAFYAMQRGLYEDEDAKTTGNSTPGPIGKWLGSIFKRDTADPSDSDTSITTTTPLVSRIGILADDAATDIPLAAAEGQHAAAFWKASKGHTDTVDHPCS